MSKPEQQVITGTSNSGNLQEALDAAVSQVGHGQAWRLASIDGLVGGFAGNDVNVRIFTVTGAATSDAAADRGGTSAGAETRQGIVEAIPDGTLSICNDGAEYELVSRTVEGETRLRLRPVNGRAGAVLKRFAGKGTEVSVTGPIIHVECTRMDVERAEEALVAT